VGKQVTSMTALSADMQLAPKECGKARREDFLSSVKACQSKTSKWRKRWNYIYL